MDAAASAAAAAPREGSRVESPGDEGQDRSLSRDALLMGIFFFWGGDGGVFNSLVGE